MANRDVVVSHQNIFDQEAYDSLTFSDIQRFSSTSQTRQECGSPGMRSRNCSIYKSPSW